MTNNNYFQNLLETRIFPLSREKEQLDYVINRMTRFMHQNPLHISETIVGGSYGKNTMIRGRAEVDLVYVLTQQGINQTYNDLIDRLVEFSTHEFNQNLLSRNNYGITINYHGVSADVLIAFPFDSPLIFHNQQLNTLMYKPYRIVLQKEFAITRGTIYQNFVRLLKYWKQRGQDRQWPQLNGLKSYLVELLAAHIFDNSDEQNSYSSLLQDFFIQIDSILTQGQQIRFNDYYQINNALQFQGWTVNDPADPSYNVVPPHLNLNVFQNYLKYSKNCTDWNEIFVN